MAPIITTARLVCKDKDAREKAFAAFHKIVEYSRANEPGVWRYVVTVPLADKDQNELYMIEEYASAEASAAHLATAPVQDLIKLFGSGEVLAGAPDVHNSTVKYAKTPASPPTTSSNPAVVLADFEYKEGTIPNALEGWKEVVNYVSANEPGTTSYSVGVEDNDKFVRTVEVYESWDYVEKVHLKSKAIAKNQDQNGKDRTGVKGAVRLRVVDGFLGRQGGGSKL